jgi:hypothetical protein
MLFRLFWKGQQSEMERSTEFETEYDNRSHFEQESYKEWNYISFKLPAAVSH